MKDKDTKMLEEAYDSMLSQNVSVYDLVQSITEGVVNGKFSKEQVMDIAQSIQNQLIEIRQSLEAYDPDIDKEILNLIAD